MRVLLALGVTLMATTAWADVELKNDGFVTNGTAGFEGGFVAGEMGASRFVAPEAGRQLTRVQLLFGGGSTATRTITLKVYDDTAGNDIPGALLDEADFQLSGSDSAMQELTLTSPITLPQQFRVAILLQTGGAPSLARDADGTITTTKNFLFAIPVPGEPGTWIKSSALGLTGDWVIRAFISDGGVAPPDGATDAGVTPMPDAGATGGACSGNGNCPEGQFCDLTAHACTFECRVDDDCGGGTCNSLGQCIGAPPSDGGGCCRVDSGAGAGGLIFGAGVLGLLLRRRPSRAA